MFIPNTIQSKSKASRITRSSFLQFAFLDSATRTKLLLHHANGTLRRASWISKQCEFYVSDLPTLKRPENLRTCLFYWIPRPSWKHNICFFVDNICTHVSIASDRKNVCIDVGEKIVGTMRTLTLHCEIEFWKIESAGARLTELNNL